MAEKLSTSHAGHSAPGTEHVAPSFFAFTQCSALSPRHSVPSTRTSLRMSLTPTPVDPTPDDDEAPSGLYRLYVVSLSPEAMSTRKFAEKNPGYRPGQPCYLVDVTDLAPDLRFDQHMAGIKDNAFVRRYGVALRPDFTVDFPPSPFPVAVEQEATIARSLRGEGCGVWAPVLDAPETSSVYVIRLGAAVLKNRRFRAANPGYVKGSPCVYVGATGLSPQERFANHKAGHKANWYAQKDGEELLPELFAHLNPMTHQRALATEIALAEELRQEGFAVWQN
jgi:predicted GIY-YIG superfamily endonuclease